MFRNKKKVEDSTSDNSTKVPKEKKVKVPKEKKVKVTTEKKVKVPKEQKVETVGESGVTTELGSDSVSSDVVIPRKRLSGKLLALLFVVFALIISLLGLAVLLNSKKVPNTPVTEAVTTTDAEPAVVSTTETDSEGSKELADTDGTTSDLDIDEEKDVATYTNNFLNFSMNYPASWFITENSEKIITLAKSVENMAVKSISSLPLASVVPLVSLDSWDTQGNEIQIALSPYTVKSKNLAGEVTTVPDIKMNLDEATITKLQTSVKEGIKEKGLSISSFAEGYVDRIGDYDVLIMEYVTGNDVNSHATLQCIVPLGGNNLVITAVSLNEPNDVDKLELLSGILSSFKFTKDLTVDSAKQ